MSLVTQTDVEQDKFRIRDDSCAILDQYLDGEELEELILEERNVFNNDLSQRSSRIDVFNDFHLKNNIRNVLKCFKMYVIVPPPTSRIKSATHYGSHIHAASSSYGLQHMPLRFMVVICVAMTLLECSCCTKLDCLKRDLWDVEHGIHQLYD